MPGCVFCRIASGEIPSAIVHKDADVVAFRDLSPQAPTHILIIPVRHVGSLHDATIADTALLGQLMLVARALAEKEGIATSGYRVVSNSGPDGGQSVFHLHLHLLGGRPMAWPPG